jgi:hypothetical protein
MSKGLADVPAKQHGERREPNQDREPIADRDAAEQNGGAQNGSDRRGAGAFYKSLHILVATVPREQGRCDQHEQKRWQEDSDGRDDGAPEAGDEIAEKRRDDHDRPRADHADRDCDEELSLVEPAELLHQSLLEEWHDDEAAAEGERAGLEKEQQQLADDRSGRGRHELGEHGWHRGRQDRRRALEETAAAIAHCNRSSMPSLASRQQECRSRARRRWQSSAE